MRTAAGRSPTRTASTAEGMKPRFQPDRGPSLGPTSNRISGPGSTRTGVPPRLHSDPRQLPLPSPQNKNFSTRKLAQVLLLPSPSRASLLPILPSGQRHTSLSSDVRLPLPLSASARPATPVTTRLGPPRPRPKYRRVTCPAPACDYDAVPPYPQDV